MIGLPVFFHDRESSIPGQGNYGVLRIIPAEYSISKDYQSID